MSKTPPEFLFLSVDLDEMIESVYVSPMADAWFRDVVVDILEKYGLDKQVFHSAWMTEHYIKLFMEGLVC